MEEQFFTPEGAVVTANRSVYMLRVPDGHVKIGIAKNPLGRLSTLQTGNHCRISVEGFTDIDPSGIPAEAMERRIHDLLEPYRVHGEWFAAPYKVAIRAWQLAWLSLRLERQGPQVPKETLSDSEKS